MIAVVVVALGLCLPGPAAAATLAVVDAMCCSPSAALRAETTSEADAGDEVERLAADRDCRCRVDSCRICAVRDGWTSRDRFTSMRVELQKSTDLSAGYRGQIANPPRAPSLSGHLTPTPRPPEQPLFLSLQVLLI